MAANLYKIPAVQGRVCGPVTLPGSKSIALRHIAMAALAEGETRLQGIPVCDDTDAMLDCVQALGVGVTRKDDVVHLTGPMDRTSPAILNARMSGASMRLLLGLAALREAPTRIDGHESLRARTNAPLLDVLRAHGCRVDDTNGCLPTTVEGPLQAPAELIIDGSLSSQYVTALLLCAPYFAIGERQVIRISGTLVSRPYVNITLHEMNKRSVEAHWTAGDQLQVTTEPYQAGDFIVEGDATAASYFAALATLHGGDIELTNLGAETRQGDYRFLEVMETLGATVERDEGRTRIRGPKRLNAIESIDMNAMPDAALTLMTLAPLLPGPLHISGLSTLRHKECDRLACPAREFAAMGVIAHEHDDAIDIEPAELTQIRAHTLNTYHDHRMAMAFSVLGSATGQLAVDDKAVVDKTYPEYWSDYQAVTGT